MTSRYSPQRVVSLQPSATVILRDLGCLDALVACTKYCVDVCPELRNRSMVVVADSWTAKSAEISAARPDLVIASVPYQEKALAEIMKSGARFLGFAPRMLADVYGDIAMIAGSMGVEEKANQVIQQMEEAIGTVRAQTRSLPKPRVFCEEWGKPLIASQPWVAELVDAAGGIFLGEPGKQISFEAAAALDPEVLIISWCGAGDRVPLEKIVASRGWENTPAAQGSRVYCIRDEYLNTPAPTLVRGLHALAAAIHPAQFPQAEGLRCINTSR